MKYFGLAIASILAGCATQAPAPRDNIVVVWNKVDDAHAACQNLNGRREVFAIRGCSKWNESDNAGHRVCAIYAPPPKNETDTQAFATLGHELMHCFDGNWHDRWGRMTPKERQAAVGG